MDDKIRAEYLQRLMEENQTWLESLRELDPEREDFADNVSAMTEWHKTIAADFKNNGDIEEEENRLKHDKKSSKISSILQAIGIVVTIGTFGIGEMMKHKHFQQANTFQDEGGFYGKTTDKIAVQDALKTERPFWQFWKK